MSAGQTASVQAESEGSMFAYKVVVTTITVFLMIVLAWVASSKVEGSGKLVSGLFILSYVALLVGMWL